jgi:IS1 family transposase
MLSCRLNPDRSPRAQRLQRAPFNEARYRSLTEMSRLHLGAVRRFAAHGNEAYRMHWLQVESCSAAILIGISTSFAERQTLSVRMGLRRYTRLTSAFSRKIESHAAAVALYYFSFNFEKILRSR